MKKKLNINISTDIIALILSSMWLNSLDFYSLSKLQIVGLVLLIIMIILMVIKLFKLKK